MTGCMNAIYVLFSVTLAPLNACELRVASAATVPDPNPLDVLHVELALVRVRDPHNSVHRALQEEFKKNSNTNMWEGE